MGDAAGKRPQCLQALRAQELPASSLGFVYLPALGWIVISSMLVAPLGAKLAHRLPIKRLRLLFAFMLYLLALRMLASFWN